jgi:hypothetical protein
METMATDMMSGENEPRSTEAYEKKELLFSFLLPHRAIAVILSDRGRFAASVSEKKELGFILLLLYFISSLAPIPYSLLSRADDYWRISVLYLGSVFICFPSLIVFGAFLGMKIHAPQMLSFSLLISATAALFTLGFAPIIWFFRITMDETSSVDVLQSLSTALLITALIAGIIHMSLCLFSKKRFGVSSAFGTLLLVWQVLLIFITCRMGAFLGVL